MEKHNKLIAKFMGYRYETGVTLGGSWSRFFKTGGVFEDSFAEAKYHKSWDWLMPVVEKIESLTNQAGVRFQVSIQSKYVWNRSANTNDFIYSVGIVQNQHRIVYEMGFTKLEATYTAVIKFIEYLNERKV